jgi:hypothetical protein
MSVFAIANGQPQYVLQYWRVEMRWPNTAKYGMVEMEKDWLPMVEMRIQKFVKKI